MIKQSPAWTPAEQHTSALQVITMDKCWKTAASQGKGGLSLFENSAFLRHLTSVGQLQSTL